MALRMLGEMENKFDRAKSDVEKEREKFEHWFNDVGPDEQVCDLVLLRHGNKAPGPTEWVNPLITKSREAKIKIPDSKDLVGEGKRNAEAFGQHFAFYDRLYPHASGEERAADTANLIVDGSGIDTNLKAVQLPDTTYGELVKKYPGIAADFKTISGEITQAKVDAPNWGMSKLDERARIGEVVEVPAMDKLVSMKGGAEAISQFMSGNVLALKNKAEAMLTGDLKKTAIPFVTHALLNEGWLMKTLRVNGQPINDLKALGGSFSPVEGFIVRFKKNKTSGETKIECKFTDPARQVLFDGAELTIDWESAKNLAGQHLETQKPKPVEEPKKEEPKPAPVKPVEKKSHH